MTKLIMVLAGSLLIASGSAAFAKDTTLRLVERATTDAITDLGAKDDSAGDLLTFANEIYDEKNEKKLGSDNGWCIRTVAARRGNASGRCLWPTVRSRSKGRFSTRATPSWRSLAGPASTPVRAAR